MNYRVRLSAKAERDVEGVLRWFDKQRAGAAASRWFAQLWAKIGTLEKQPLRCPLAAESTDLSIELRELLFGRRHGKYRILFLIEGIRVQILHIRHAARDAISADDVSL